MRLAEASSVLRFCAAAFALSWLPWAVLLARGGDPTAGIAESALWVLGGFGPALAAVWAARRDGPGQARRLLAGLLRWRVAARWYAALLIPLDDCDPPFTLVSCSSTRRCLRDETEVFRIVRVRQV